MCLLSPHLHDYMQPQCNVFFLRPLRSCSMLITSVATHLKIFEGDFVSKTMEIFFGRDKNQLKISQPFYVSANCF